MPGELGASGVSRRGFECVLSESGLSIAGDKSRVAARGRGFRSDVRRSFF
jgi:hypothetical protein